MSDDSTIRFAIDDETYELDLEQLTLDELCEIEDFVGRSYQHIDWESARGLKALAWVAMSRSKPGFSFADAGALRLSSFGEAEDEKKPRPTKARKSA